MRTGLRLRLAHLLIRQWARWLYLRLGLTVRAYRRRQERLARRYSLGAIAPEPYGPATEASIARAASRLREPPVFALTSGTTGEPKRILYPRRRLRRVRQTLLEQLVLTYDFLTTNESLRLRRPIFYTLTDLRPNASLSSLLAHRYRMGWSGTVMERVLFADSFVPRREVSLLAERYPEAAVHLVCLALIAPALILTVNPSSLFALLTGIQRDWDELRADASALLCEPVIIEMQRRLGRAGTDRAVRLRGMLDRPAPPGARDLLAELEAVSCWDGGYVQPYIENLRALFPGGAPILAPLFSLSTETVAYEHFPRLSTAGGFPIAPAVCYEFLPDHESGRETPPRMPKGDGSGPEAMLLKPWELERGRSYVMVISDPYGLRRYDTDDIFRCTGMVRDTPLLCFERRAGLGYSFTGEKVTAAQLTLVYEQIRRDLPLPGLLCTCFPALALGDLPRYIFVCCGAGEDGPDRLTADRFDRILMEINMEYAAKRAGRRLAAPELRVVRDADVLERLARRDARYQDVSPAQGKVLPLYEMLWNVEAERIAAESEWTPARSTA